MMPHIGKRNFYGEVADMNLLVNKLLLRIQKIMTTF